MQKSIAADTAAAAAVSAVQVALICKLKKQKSKSTAARYDHPTQIILSQCISCIRAKKRKYQMILLSAPYDAA
jgi:hypothetical protein